MAPRTLSRRAVAGWRDLRYRASERGEPAARQRHRPVSQRSAVPRRRDRERPCADVPGDRDDRRRRRIRRRYAGDPGTLRRSRPRAPPAEPRPVGGAQRRTRGRAWRIRRFPRRGRSLPAREDRPSGGRPGHASRRRARVQRVALHRRGGPLPSRRGPTARGRGHAPGTAPREPHSPARRRRPPRPRRRDRRLRGEPAGLRGVGLVPPAVPARHAVGVDRCDARRLSRASRAEPRPDPHDARKRDPRSRALLLRSRAAARASRGGRTRVSGGLPARCRRVLPGGAGRRRGSGVSCGGEGATGIPRRGREPALLLPRPHADGGPASRHRRPALARGHGYAAQRGAHALSPAGPRVRGRGVPRASTLGRAAGDRATCPQATELGPRGRWSRHRRRQRAARHGRDPVSRTLLVAFGGMLGSIARYWLAGVIQRLDGVEFPFGTLGVNVLGSFIVGVVMALSLERGTLPPNARIFLAIGLCGGFTTMSTFSYETMALLRDGQAILGLGNVAATLIACLVAVWLGQV